MLMTSSEEVRLQQIADRLAAMRDHLVESIPQERADAVDWLECLVGLRELQGNHGNDASFVAKLLAKQYFAERFPLARFGATDCKEGGRGHDIDFVLPSGERVIGEVKTTIPCDGNRLGGNQSTELRKDFRKLRDTDAQYKFLFLTCRRTHEIALTHQDELPGVEVIMLGNRAVKP